jgi:PGAP1-like protein
MPTRIVPPYYPIVYVRGYAMTASAREETFNNAYYGFADTSVEKRQAPPPDYFAADVFESQLIRFMKMKQYQYCDAVNRDKTNFLRDPTRSIWISRFYDQDFFQQKVRNIQVHAEELRQLVCEEIPNRLKNELDVDLGPRDQDYKVILLAHSMGGLVCRTLIQNLLPNRHEDPKRWIYRLVTMGTPHGGIKLGLLPIEVQNFLTSVFNPMDANMFSEDEMRKYLLLEDTRYDVYSLGGQGEATSFPVKRCFCLIGSDYGSYQVGMVIAKHVTGDFSDGLVKQDCAYLVAGPRPAKNADGTTADYPDSQRAYWANVHRAHSGYRGIVNSYESFENLHRFLFGNIKADISLENICINTAAGGPRDFYDFEFMFSIRKLPLFFASPTARPVRERHENEPSRSHAEWETIPAYRIHEFDAG